MASLKRLIQKRGILADAYLDEISISAPELCKIIMHHETILVNIQNVVNQLDGHPVPDMEDVVPPFQNMWLEYHAGVCAIGFLVLRPRSVEWEQERLFAIFGFAGIQGQARFFKMAHLQLGEYGELVKFHVTPPSDDHRWKIVNGTFRYALEALCRMNTEGTRVEPPWTELKNLPMKPRKIVPSSVWHTIHINLNDHEKDRTGSAVSREAAERREHWVRACRKDYRKGNGLFGHIKKLIWVPEHKRGDPKLGQVIPEYVVH